MGFFENMGLVPIHLFVNRVIYPVGQGAFYGERIETGDAKTFSVVYDCGSDNKDMLKQQIFDYYRIRKKIDIVFVSHFHKDHINGIETLLKQADVERVVIPSVSPVQFLVDYVYNCIEGSDEDAIVFMLRCLPVLDDRRVTPGDSKFIEIAKTLISYPICDSIWLYDTFYANTNVSDKYGDFVQTILTYLSTKLSKPLDSATFFSEEVYREIRESIASNNTLLNDLKNLYQKEFKEGHNSYSMCVHSHYNKSATYVHPFSERFGRFDCLYTGDAEFDDDCIKKVKELSPVMIQMPHHGSGHNHNENLYSSGQIAFVSVGEENRYHHPSLSALSYVVKTCKEVRIVAEDTPYFKASQSFVVY